MSALGNGSADAGADVMDQIVKEVRQKAYGNDGRRFSDDHGTA
jgi:hypothetical protein